MNSQAMMLAKEIDHFFPVIGMPSPENIPAHLDGCSTCAQLASDLNVYRDKPIDAALIREIHQEMSHLSANAWRWVLPHYLRFCLTPEAEYSCFETEFLIYNLVPATEFEVATKARLSLLSDDQVRVLRDFLTHLLSTDYWRNYSPAKLTRGVAFLSEILEERSSPGD